MSVFPINPKPAFQQAEQDEEREEFFEKPRRGRRKGFCPICGSKTECIVSLTVKDGTSFDGPSQKPGSNKVTRSKSVQRNTCFECAKKAYEMVEDYLVRSGA